LHKKIEHDRDELSKLHEKIWHSEEYFKMVTAKYQELLSDKQKLMDQVNSISREKDIVSADLAEIKHQLVCQQLQPVAQHSPDQPQPMSQQPQPEQPVVQPEQQQPVVQIQLAVQPEELQPEQPKLVDQLEEPQIQLEVQHDSPIPVIQPEQPQPEDQPEQPQQMIQPDQLQPVVQLEQPQPEVQIQLEVQLKQLIPVVEPEQSQIQTELSEQLQLPPEWQPQPQPTDIQTELPHMEEKKQKKRQRQRKVKGAPRTKTNPQRIMKGVSKKNWETINPGRKRRAAEIHNAPDHTHKRNRYFFIIIFRACYNLI